MNSKVIYIGLLLAICLSLYFTYERSFVTRDFEVVNSEEEEALLEDEEVSTEAGAEQEIVPATEVEVTQQEAE
jgi:hypothetical protein